jgi:DNA-binding NarL/FixJ family response regulator
MARILLLTEQPLLATGMEAVLRSADGFELTTVDNLANLLEKIDSATPDILVMDFVAEEYFNAAVSVRNHAPRCPIVLLAYNISVEAAFQALNLGIRGILRTTLSAELILKCLQKVLQGELWFDKNLTAGLLEARRISLTPRESQLVVLVSQGLKNKEIAAALSISEATVRVYLSALFRKTGVRDRYELAIRGLKNLANKQPMASSDTSVPAVLSSPPSRSTPEMFNLLIERS